MLSGKAVTMSKITFPLFAILVLGAGAQDVTIEVNAAKDLVKIPRTIYGTFLEPIGNSTYGGLWAQILENPSLEDNLWSAERLRAKLDANPALYRASALGLPVPWEPLDQAQGARYEPRWNEAANSHRSLLLMALPAHETGIRQEVYLPVHRTLEYRGSFYAKHVAGPGRVEVSLRQRNRNDVIYASEDVEAAKPEWTKYSFSLHLGQGKVASLQPVDFVVSGSNGTRVLLDQIFLWPSDSVQGMDPEMVAMSKSLRTPIVRFGGNYTSAYHWRDGIGPMDKRESMLNLAWGMPEYNHFGTDEFLEFCRLVDAEPQIALNLGTGTPPEAADWVRYVNEKWNGGKGGLVWELGNELWGNFQTGYPTLGGIANLTKEFATAVRGVDPKSILIATGQDPDHFKEWNAEQLKNAGLFDYLATHFVVRPADVRAKAPSNDFIARVAFALPVELERKLREMHQQIQTSPNAGSRVGIAFTEWLFWGADDRTPRFTNQAGALAAAGMLNTLLRTADFTRISDMTGLIEFGGIWKKRGRVFGVPAYWAFRMYSTANAATTVEVRTNTDTYDVHDGNVRLPEITDVPYLDVVAARSDTGGKLTLFCVNRHLTRYTSASIRLNAFRAEKRVRVETLSAPSIHAANDEAQPERVVPVETYTDGEAGGIKHIFPPASLTVLEFEKAR
jgi:alpha-N-arabinofuranosidase